MNESCIYIIKSKRSPKKFYIGSALDFRKRKNTHLYDLRKKKHHSKILQGYFNKYGEEDLTFEIIEPITDVKKLIEREQVHIDLNNPFFNILKIAGSRLGSICSLETRQKLRIINIGKKHTEETKQKIKNGQVGKKTNAGFVQTDDARKRISAAMKGVPKSPQTIENMIASQTIRQKESRDRRTLTCPTCKIIFVSRKMCKNRIVTFCSKSCHTKRDKTNV